MLILTRSTNERLFINNNEIVITVLGIRGNQVRLGIEAPRHISVNREEIQARIEYYANESNSEGVENG